MNNIKLPISIGILSWKSSALEDTLYSYKDNGLFDMVEDICIFFQEPSKADYALAYEYGIRTLQSKINIGIGHAFYILSNMMNSQYFIPMEHDWKLIEDEETTYSRLLGGIKLLEGDIDIVRYRHKEIPGFPHTSFRYRGKELELEDKWHPGKINPHLLDSIHWVNPSECFPDKIQKIDDWFITNTRWATWTNNPCMYNRKFYKDFIEPHRGIEIDLEYNISKVWHDFDFRIAQGNGLFTHCDIKKYGTC